MNYSLKTILSIFISSLVLSTMNCQEYTIGKIKNYSEYFVTLEINQVNKFNITNNTVREFNPKEDVGKNVKKKDDIKFTLEATEQAFIKVFTNDKVYIFPIDKALCILTKTFEVFQDKYGEPAVRHNKYGDTQKNAWQLIPDPNVYNRKEPEENPEGECYRIIGPDDESFDREFQEIGVLSVMQPNLTKVQAEEIFNRYRSFYQDWDKNW